MELGSVVGAMEIAEELGGETKGRWEKYQHLDMTPAEACFVYVIMKQLDRRSGRVAEIRTGVGATTRLMADALGKGFGGTIEVYDNFEHTAATIKRYGSGKGANDSSYFEIWRDNTRSIRSMIELHRGHFLSTARDAVAPLDILYVNGVPDERLMQALQMSFYRRLRVGGILIHREYFRWQFPWAAAQMPLLSGSFTKVGDVDYNMCVFVKTAEVEDETAQVAMALSGRKAHEALELEIKDYNAARAGMLKVAKLRLAMDDPSFDWLGYRQEIIDQHGKAPRVMRYLDTLNQFAISARR